ncbi:MAG: ribonuclease III [Lachnospiraceae bacterium]|nr:ribonuclease III [Lachnospiraceae bacterium]
MIKNGIGNFESIIGYSFNNKELLKLALTHSSYSNENKKINSEDNERLEFLGDAALDLVISAYIYRNFPDMFEGELTKLRAGVVCESGIAKMAREIRLGDFIRLGHGEETTGGRQRESILADAFEAVIGAVYLDGGLEETKRFILGLMIPEINSVKDSFKSLDAKTHLQEFIQRQSKMPINYIITGETGPDHDKIFTASVEHEGKLLGAGQGKSKKEAEQDAAYNALKKLEANI